MSIEDRSNVTVEELELATAERYAEADRQRVRNRPSREFWGLLALIPLSYGAFIVWHTAVDRLESWRHETAGLRDEVRQLRSDVNHLGKKLDALSRR